MGFGLGFGAFVSGATDGYDRSRARTRADEQDKWLREDHDEKVRLRDETKNFATDMESIQKSRMSGGIPGVDGLSPEGQAFIDQGNASYDRVEAARLGKTPATSAIAPPVDSSVAPTDAPATGVSSPNAAPVQSAQTTQAAPNTPSLSRTEQQNKMFQNGSGLYANQSSADGAYYKQVEDRTAKYLYATGQGDRVPALKKQIQDMQQQEYEPLRQAAADALAVGAPNALELVSKASRASGYGANIDPSSGSYDAKTQTWKGVSVTDPSGKTEKHDLTMSSLLVGLHQVTPAAAVAMNFGRTDAEFDKGIKERTTASGEMTARSNAAVAKATVDIKGIAVSNQTMALENHRNSAQAEIERKREGQFTKELETDLFRGKDPSMMKPADQEKLTRTASIARNLFAVPGNESLNAATLAGVARGLGNGSARVTELPASAPEAQRKGFLQAEYAGATILIPRSTLQQSTK